MVNLRLETRSRPAGSSARRHASGPEDVRFATSQGTYNAAARRASLAILPIWRGASTFASGSSGGTVSGRVVLDEGVTAAMPRVSIDITERLVGQPDPSMLGVFQGRYAAVTPSAEDGAFAVSHVFGPAPLNVGVPDDWMVKSILRNGRDMADAPLELRTASRSPGCKLSSPIA